jgi:hypothetical protein
MKRDPKAFAFDKPGARATIFLPKRHRLVVIAAGQSPRLLPITSAGHWDIVIPPEVEAAAREWPILVVVMRPRDAALYQTMLPERAIEIIRKVRGACGREG